MRQGARGWCTGMAQRDGTGREVGGGIQDGEHSHKYKGKNYYTGLYEN